MHWRADYMGLLEEVVAYSIHTDRAGVDVKIVEVDVVLDAVAGAPTRVPPVA